MRAISKCNSLSSSDLFSENMQLKFFCNSKLFFLLSQKIPKIIISRIIQKLNDQNVFFIACFASRSLNHQKYSKVKYKCEVHMNEERMQLKYIILKLKLPKNEVCKNYTKLSLKPAQK